MSGVAGGGRARKSARDPDAETAEPLLRETPARAMEMTPAVLRDICEKAKGYRTPGLNDVLYAHYKVREARRLRSSRTCDVEPDCAAGSGQATSPVRRRCGAR